MGFSCPHRKKMRVLGLELVAAGLTALMADSEVEREVDL